MKLFPKKIGLFPLLLVVITFVVTVIIFIHSMILYYDLKDNFEKQTVHNIEQSAKKLSQNISPLIQSYQINQYLNLIETEIILNKYLAITIVDNMYSEILGKSHYIDGYLLQNNQLYQISQLPNEYKNSLENAYLTYSEAIKVGDKNIGKITIYATNEELSKALDELVEKRQIDSLSIIIVLIVVLYLLMQFLYVTPLSSIINVVKDTDQFGVPKAVVPDSIFVEISLLSEKINTMVNTIRKSQAKLLKHSQELEYASSHDPLTGLPNRIELNDQLTKALHHHLKTQKELALLYIDLDGFKIYNDTYGHALGDEILIELANRIKKLIRQEDLIARLGGDEFVIVLSNAKKDLGFFTFMDQLLQEISRPIESKLGHVPPLSISSSIGITFFSKENNLGVDALLRQADQAMFEAKSSGRNRYLIYNIDMEKELTNYQHAKKEFLLAIENGELEMYYQPKVELSTQRVFGVEALLRWNHPEKGVLAPGFFLDKFLDDLSVMDALDKNILQKSIQQLSKWLEEGKEIVLSINVTTQRLISSEFEKDLEIVMEKFPNVKPPFVEFEILESTSLKNIQQTIEVLHRLRAKGYSISLDDYGTGYSSLSYLKDLPVDCLKIDQSFVIDYFDNEGSKHIVEGCIMMARAFNLKIIAEGVETQKHVEALIAQGCEYGQGYHFSKPVPASELNF